jgi:hydrogenase nickel incorporation protein HypA/HybF
MHELSLSSAIVDTVIRHAQGRPVTSVQMRIGALRQVVPDSLAFYFDIVARDTVCEGARLEQEFLPARLRCDACAREWEIDFPIFLCPSCGTGGDVRIVAGEEFEVESIDVEEVAECTAPR